MLEDLLQPNALQQIEQYIDVSLRDVYNGSIRTVTLRRRELCPKCFGIGSSGLLSLPCSRCNTEGAIIHEKTMQYSIPAGIDTGTSFHIQDDSPKAQPGAEFVVVFRVVTDPSFSRQGSDLYTTIELPADVARSGGTSSIVLPDGKRIGFPLAPNTQDGSVIPLTGRGLPYPNDLSHRGNLYMRVQVTLNQILPQAVAHPPTEHSARTVKAIHQPAPHATPTQIGNYRIVRQIGEGGFAVVYLGQHRYLNSQVAIKVLKQQLASVEDFLREAQTIAQLKHPHIIDVLDCGVEGTLPYVIMNYAPGGSLEGRHPVGSRLPETMVVDYVRQVAEALQHAHNQRIIHRDIKPANMLVGADDSILLSDFGIAITAHGTQSMQIEEAVGTVSYMAPEQIQGSPRSASDQYALGVVAYEWLCGEAPYHGFDAMSVAMQHINTPPPLLHTKVSTISPTVEWVILKALAKDPYQRFDSIQAFAHALESAACR